MKKAFLFDIDGTLITTGGAGRAAMSRAFEDLFKVPDPFHGDTFSGKTDPIIFRTAAVRHFGRNPTPDEERAFTEHYIECLPEDLAASPDYRVLPGVDRLLEALSARPDCLLGLCTGNMEPGARLKLKQGDLNRFFEFGGYGSDSGDRAELTRLACERAVRLAGGPVEPLVVGDSTRDEKAARDNGYAVALVATGWTEPEVLRELAPDFFFDSFEDTECAVARLMGLGEGLRADPDHLERAVHRLRQGGVIIHPTSTLYGFGGDATNPAVAARIRGLKGGRAGPFIVLASDTDAALSLAAEVPDGALALARDFWPGPLTLVLPAAKGVLPGVQAPDGTFAVRVDPHPVARDLCRALDRPLLSTSANRSGAPPPGRAADVDAALVAATDLFIEDAAPLAGAPSTVVRFAPQGLEVLREGAISAADLAVAVR
ncbi:MAG: threonylcarbamoyl-AMP synthase [Deltaproteobacteria bacterium]|nr:threonylcarbamoyl-AMP synthase [Deltaproteobacteria bacterium]